jgi:hypothetical protein
MYTIDGKDKVVLSDAAPLPEPGALMPMLIQTDTEAAVVYYVNRRDTKWTPPGDDESGEELVATVRFHAHATMFGPPNEEAFAGHPLSNRGLQRYAVHEVRDSSWLRGLERMNAVHPHHDSARFFSR